MNPQWIVAAAAVANVLGFAGNAIWSYLNVRMDNKILRRIDALKANVTRDVLIEGDRRYVLRADQPHGVA